MVLQVVVVREVQAAAELGVMDWVLAVIMVAQAAAELEI